MSINSWRSLLLRIGDKCPEYGGSSDFKEHIEIIVKDKISQLFSLKDRPSIFYPEGQLSDTCYSALLRDWDNSKNDIFELLLQCAEQLPHKIPFYGVLVGLINLENENFAKRVVEIAHSRFQDVLTSEDCDRIRILLRFLTVLMCSNVVQPGSLVGVFETLLSSAATTVDAAAGQARADFYVTCILSSLPWGGAALVEQVPEEFERVMVGVQSYFSIRKCSNDMAFTIFESEEVKHEVKHRERKDFLEDLWDRIQILAGKGWRAESVPRPHLLFESQLVAGPSHALAPVSCPEQVDVPSSLSQLDVEKIKYETVLKYPRRLCRLDIFPSGKAEENMQPIDRFVVEEYLLDVLLFFNGCRKECASFLAGLPVPFRYDYLMAETIFSQLLLLPKAPFNHLYYTLVIIDLCKALPGAFPSVVVGAVRALFDKIPDMDMECRTRLILWFSHHLSNFQYIWPWGEWAYVKDLPRWAPQRVFVQEVLEREIRLSYYDRIKQSIENSPELEELLPPKGGPNFRYSSNVDGAESLTEGHKLSSEFKNMVRGRKGVQEIISWTEENIISPHGNKIAIEVVIQTLLDIGSKSFTHLITVIERYGKIIGKLCPDQESQYCLIMEVSSFWKNNTQMTATTIDRMMGYRLISNLAIVSWVFSPSNVDQFHLSDRPWEILKNAINKTYNRITDLKKEVLSLEKSVSLSKEATAKAQKELEAAESRYGIVDGQPVPAENASRLKRLKGYAARARDEETSIKESLEAKEALFSRAIEENKALFLELYKNFRDVLNERLPPVSADGKLPNLRAGNDNINNSNMAVDAEEPQSMEVEQENGKDMNSQMNDVGMNTGYNIDEQEQWCLTTLGYVKAFSRMYASEIWPHIEMLDAEVFVENVHPLFKKAAYTGLCRKL